MTCPDGIFYLDAGLGYRLMGVPCMYMYLVSAVRVLYIKAFIIFKYRLIQRLHKHSIGLKSICTICCIVSEWHL